MDRVGCCDGAHGNVDCTTGKGLYRTRERKDFKNDYDGNRIGGWRGPVTAPIPLF